jgi:hypothetical protein
MRAKFTYQYEPDFFAALLRAPLFERPYIGTRLYGKERAPPSDLRNRYHRERGRRGATYGDQRAGIGLLQRHHPQARGHAAGSEARTGGAAEAATVTVPVLTTTASLNVGMQISGSIGIPAGSYIWELHADKEMSFELMARKQVDAPTYAMVTPERLRDYCVNCGPKHVVITGGEPCDHDLTQLTTVLRESGKVVTIGRSSRMKRSRGSKQETRRCWKPASCGTASSTS